MGNVKYEKSVLFIRAGKGMVVDGLKSLGYVVIKPYGDNNLVLRICREIWFRLNLPYKGLWYNKQILEMNPDHIIIYDPQITKEYMEWLNRNLILKNRSCILHFFYGNMVGKARHVIPNDIPPSIDVWTFDAHDSRKFGLKLCTNLGYFPFFCQTKQDIEYDVLFIGRDKGRAEYILDLEKKMNEIGLRTYFHIVGDGRLTKHKKPFYKPEIKYEVICKLIAKSKAILNISLEGQEGITIRDMESIYNKVKLITTNAHIKKQKFYNEHNIFIIGEQDLSELSQFIRDPYIDISQTIIECYTIGAWISEIITKS